MFKVGKIRIFLIFFFSEVHAKHEFSMKLYWPVYFLDQAYTSSY